MNSLFRELREAPVLPLEEAQQVCFSHGIPDHQRRFYWSILLSYIPSHKHNREMSLKASREQYQLFLRETEASMQTAARARATSTSMKSPQVMSPPEQGSSSASPNDDLAASPDALHSPVASRQFSPDVAHAVSRSTPTAGPGLKPPLFSDDSSINDSSVDHHRAPSAFEQPQAAQDSSSAHRDHESKEEQQQPQVLDHSDNRDDVSPAGSLDSSASLEDLAAAAVASFIGLHGAVETAAEARSLSMDAAEADKLTLGSRLVSGDNGSETENAALPNGVLASPAPVPKPESALLHTPSATSPDVTVTAEARGTPADATAGSPTASCYADTVLMEDAEMQRQVDKDLERTFPDLNFFAKPGNIEPMRRILVTFARLNRGLGYIQGMHEVGCGAAIDHRWINGPLMFLAVVTVKVHLLTAPKFAQ